jgi:hypothetical protein
MLCDIQSSGDDALVTQVLRCIIISYIVTKDVRVLQLGRS